jgi:rRNA maturation RNase YbeY|tara:strand:- start:350 stop:760 length:411 start_codon:yes stop_codon:yes gene_type:complete
MINYFSSTDYVVNNKDELTLWLEAAIIKEGRTLGELVFNFCSDETLLKINKEFLNHDTLTDVITFDYCVNNEVSGEVFISTERVRENANEYQQSFDQEKRRVMIHGVLHLCGYKDKTDKDRALMSEMESFYLDSFS